MGQILDTFSLIFKIILHFKDELIEVQRHLLMCPRHRAGNGQNHYSYPNLSGFNPLVLPIAVLQLSFFLGVLEYLFLDAITEAFQHQSS